MERGSVKSSMIKSLGYDASSFLLEVEFTNGRVYQYLDVPSDVYSSVVDSDFRRQIVYCFDQEARLRA